MTDKPITWETKKVQIQSSSYPWDGTRQGYFDLMDFVPAKFLRYGELERCPAVPVVEVYNILEDQWLNVPEGHWLVKGLKGEFYPCESEAMEMKYRIVDPVLTIEKLLEGANGLPDSYDDPRIDNVCSVVKSVLQLVQKNGAISLDQIEEIVANSTEHPDFWDEDRVW